MLLHWLNQSWRNRNEQTFTEEKKRIIEQHDIDKNNNYDLEI